MELPYDPAIPLLVLYSKKNLKHESEKKHATQMSLYTFNNDYLLKGKIIKDQKRCGK